MSMGDSVKKCCRFAVFFVQTEQTGSRAGGSRLAKRSFHELFYHPQLLFRVWVVAQRQVEPGRFFDDRLFRSGRSLFVAPLFAFADLGVFQQRRSVLYFQNLSNRHPAFVAARSLETRRRNPAEGVVDASFFRTLSVRLDV